MHREKNRLSVGPVQSGGTQQSPSTLMVESSISFYITSQWRDQRLATRCDPVKNGAFQAFRVVRSCARSSFLDLWTISVGEVLKIGKTIYEFANVDKIFGGASLQAFVNTRYHLHQHLKDPMLSPFPVEC